MNILLKIYSEQPYTRLYSVKLQSINQAEYLRMDIGRKQIVLHVEKCILPAKNLHS